MSKDISNNINICNYEGCNRRLKLTDIECKCNQVFCKIHKYPDSHNCTYDYKENNKKQQRIDEMKCVSNKIPKIF